MATPEQLVLRDKFTVLERERLLADGAKIYLPRYLTIEQQEVAQSEKGQPALSYKTQVADGLLDLPSRPIEMAIYPGLKRFFVEGSFDKDITTQETLVAEAGQCRSKRLGLPWITQIIAREAATLSDIIQHLNQTGVWLFGPTYAATQGEEWVYSRTKDPTDISKNGFWFAFVGGVRLGGLQIRDWPGIGVPFIGVIHLVVAVAQVDRVPDVEMEKLLVAA